MARPQFGLLGLLSTQPGPDLVCLGCAELGVQVQGLLPAAAGLLVPAGAVVASGEVVVEP